MATTPEVELSTDRLLNALYTAAGAVVEAQLIEKRERANAMGFTYDIPTSSVDKLRLLRRFIEYVEPAYECALLELENASRRD